MYSFGSRNLPSLVLMICGVLLWGLPGMGLFQGIARREASRQPGGVVDYGSDFQDGMGGGCVPRMKASSWVADHCLVGVLISW